MPVLHMADINLAGKRVLLREDLNVPLNAQGEIVDDTRIRASVDTLRKAIEAGAKVMVMSHLGRPHEGKYDERYSLSPIAKRLGQLLPREIPVIRDWLGTNGVQLGSLNDADVVILENVRFNVGEKQDDEGLSRRMAALCDVFVMDAFASAHRAQASTHGVARFAPIACAGPLLANEIEALSKAMQNPAHPIVALVSGAKISTKLEVLMQFIAKTDQLLVGEGIANTLMLAEGMSIGKSLCEPNLLADAKKILKRARIQGTPIPLPTDVITADQMSDHAIPQLGQSNSILPNSMILDIGPKTARHYADILQRARTIIWNGPVGVFEIAAFSHGTEAIGRAIAASSAYSLAGGGDTVAAIHKLNIVDQISYISTGGGAFLEFLEGKTLSAIEILQKRYSEIDS